jgi:2-methylcitrate dehydratase PrpD
VNLRAVPHLKWKPESGDFMSSVIETIANWSRFDHRFSDLARLRAKHAIADTIGCMVAGGGDFSTRAARAAFAAGIGVAGPSLVIGGGRGSAALAALVNATSAHALDYDDNFRPAITHASAVLVPALLAVAQAQNADGRTLVDAYLVGLEAQAAIGRGVNPSHYTLGWHSTSTVGAIGTAAGVAWLSGLDTGGIGRAMSLAASMASGTKGQFGTPAKPLHAGLAARNAVEAAELAAAGMTGRLDILEGPQGFLELFGGRDAKGWAGLVLASPHVIEVDGLTPKRHPCCGSTHNTIDAILDLRAEHGFAADDVAAVESHVGIANARNLAYPEPTDEMQARFSMQYCVALALRGDRLTLADFTPEAVARDEVRRLLPITTMTSYSREDELKGIERLPHQVTVRLHDGRVIHAERKQAKGSMTDPFDEEDRRAKFFDCCSRLGEAVLASLYDRLQSLDDASDLAFLEAAFASTSQAAALATARRGLVSA